MITLFTKAFQQKVFHHLYVFIIGKLSCVTQRRKTFLSFNNNLNHFINTVPRHVLRVSREYAKHFLEFTRSVQTKNVVKK